MQALPHASGARSTHLVRSIRTALQLGAAGRGV